MRITLIVVLILLCSNFGICQNWKNYNGILEATEDKKEIELKILFLKESIIIGSYREINSPTQYKLVGEIKKDSVNLVIRLSSNNEFKGVIEGKFRKKQKLLNGILKNKDNIEIGIFNLKQVYNESYTDYLKEHRNLYEYKSFQEALSNPKKVKSIDISNQQIETIPDIFNRFENLVSINLLGNNLDTFPIELTRTPHLNELSLSSNKLKEIGKEIGKLNELRILIMNFNQIKEIPKEIGNLTELLYLDLGDNQIKRFPDEISNLKKLQEFHVDDNLLSEKEKERLQKLLPNCVIHFGR